jgi:hypothetical protein
MKKTLIIIIELIFLLTAANAQLSNQRKYEFTFGTGLTQFFGDLGGYSNGQNNSGLKDLTFKNTGFNINLNSRYWISGNVAARLSLALGSLHSTDIRGSNENRRYESTTLFFEPAVIGEYYFIRNKGENNCLLMKLKGENPRSLFSLFNLYAFAGFGGLQYTAMPNDNLQPYLSHTSGFTVVIPGGFGFSMNYSNYVSFGFEFGVRYPFSDNLDGYAPPDSRFNDIYQFLNFTFTYKI